MRFITDQTTDFMRNEMAPLRELTPDVPITTNFMRAYTGLNYWKMAPELDVISWDSYPPWHGSQDDGELAAEIGFVHDIMRSLKGGKPFMLMESTPSMTNWMPVAKLKRPGMHVLSSLQAVAHGSDTVQYFQWRKSRGSSEKFHGAVVDHSGRSDTRVFQDVAAVGGALERLEAVVGTTVRPQVAVIYDTENLWAVHDAQGPRQEKKDYLATCVRHYRCFWQRGIPVDVLDMEQDLSAYKVVIAPMLYMIRPGVGERIEAFVEGGGTFVATYWSGLVDQDDLCFLTGFPGPLRRVLGVWVEEIDALYDGDVNYVEVAAGNDLGLGGRYEAREFCELLHLEGAEALATYAQDFYAGRPALTVNRFGEGEAYLIASRNEDRFLSDFYAGLAASLALQPALEADLPAGVTAQLRTDGEQRYVFLMNFGDATTVDLGDRAYIDLLGGQTVTGEQALERYGVMVLSH
jgi:beta-galactosidase